MAREEEERRTCLLVCDVREDSLVRGLHEHLDATASKLLDIGRTERSTSLPAILVLLSHSNNLSRGGGAQVAQSQRGTSEALRKKNVRKMKEELKKN